MNFFKTIGCLAIAAKLLYGGVEDPKALNLKNAFQNEGYWVEIDGEKDYEGESDLEILTKNTTQYLRSTSGFCVYTPDMVIEPKESINGHESPVWIYHESNARDSSKIAESGLPVKYVTNDLSSLAKAEDLLYEQFGFRSTDLDDPAFKDDKADVKAWPNPFNGNVNLEIFLKENNKVDVEILDVKGRKVKSFPSVDRKGSYRLEWDALDDKYRPVASGPYIVVASCADKIISKVINYRK